MKKGIKNTQKAVLSFKFVKTQIMSGSQDQKERKTASTVTTIFLEQKITSAQIRFCNDRWPSRLVEWTNNEHIKITLLATHSQKKKKNSLHLRKKIKTTFQNNNKSNNETTTTATTTTATTTTTTATTTTTTATTTFTTRIIRMVVL